jgi:hypothetical protein
MYPKKSLRFLGHARRGKVPFIVPKKKYTSFYTTIYIYTLLYYVCIYIYIHNILKKYLDLSNLGIFIFLWLSPSRPCSCWSLALPCCFGCFGFGTGNSRRPEKSEPTPPDVVKCDRRVGLGFPGLEHLKFKCAYLFKGPASTAEIYLRSMSHYAESESLEDA